MRKIAFTILAFALGSFGVSRVGGLPAKIAVGGSIAWAQDSTPADDAVDDSGDDVVPLKKTPPPDLAGTWSGPIVDNDLGHGTITLKVDQKGKSLSGTWSDTFGLTGRIIKGKIAGDAFTVTLTENGLKCKGKWVGTLVEPTEITGTYTIFGCKISDGGTFNICTPACL